MTGPVGYTPCKIYLMRLGVDPTVAGNICKQCPERLDDCKPTERSKTLKSCLEALISHSASGASMAGRAVELKAGSAQVDASVVVESDR